MFLDALVLSMDMILFIALALGLALMIYGHSSKIRIFNLLSCGIFLFIAIQLASYVPILIVLLGLIIFELYFTFKGE
jgi:hypothetical protein